MNAINQYYHYGSLNSNLPPDSGNCLDFNKIYHVQDENQILLGDFAIPESCFGVSFTFRDIDPTFESFESALFIKSDRICPLDKIAEKFGENSELYNVLLDLGAEFAVDKGNDNYGLPIEQASIFIVEGDDYSYKITGFRNNPAFGQKPKASVATLHENYRAAKKKFSTYFSNN